MKVWLGLFVVAIGWGWGGEVRAGGFSLVSPDHPDAWYNKAGDVLSQELSWDNKRNELMLYVAFSRTMSTSLRDPLLYDSFRVGFPAARLDRVTGEIYFVDREKKRRELGRLEAGLLQPAVHLDPNVGIVTNRDDGVIKAALQSPPG
jgi:hypothetical protein